MKREEIKLNSCFVSLTRFLQMRKWKFALMMSVIGLEWRWNHVQLKACSGNDLSMSKAAEHIFSLFWSSPILFPVSSDSQGVGWGGIDPLLKGHCVTHSTHAIFRRKRSWEFVPPSDFRLFSSSLSHPLWAVWCWWTCCRYAILSPQHNRPNFYLLGASQKAPWKIPQGSGPL